MLRSLWLRDGGKEGRRGEGGGGGGGQGRAAGMGKVL